MGLFKKLSDSYYSSPPQTSLPNPNPKNFTILERYEKSGIIAVKVHYPDCTNFEGKKIIVLTTDVYNAMLQQAMFDPHFSDNPQYCPTARVVANDVRWALALSLVDSIYDLERLIT